MRIDVKCNETGHAADSRAVIVAVCVACILALTHTMIHHAIAARLTAPADVNDIDPNILKRFPMKIGHWHGEQVPIDQAILRRTGAEGHVNRRYTRSSGLESISFYLAYGANARSVMPHRPEVCYVGSGWTLVERRLLELPLGGEAVLPCSVLQFSRGLLNVERIMVLHYYIIDGKYCHDVSLLRSRAWRGSRTVRHVVQIQIVASITGTLTSDSAADLVSEFAVDSTSLIAGLFGQMETDQKGGSTRAPQEGSSVDGNG